MRLSRLPNADHERSSSEPGPAHRRRAPAQAYDGGAAAQDPGPVPLAGQVALFGFEEVPRQARQLKPGPAIPSYGPFALEAPPGPPAPTAPGPTLAPDPIDERS